MDTTLLIIKKLPIKEVIASETGLSFHKNTLSQCPFCGSGTHRNGTSAFSVKDDFFKCFSCGKSGSIIDFIIEYKKMEFKQAVKYLADRYNIELEKTQPTGKLTDWQKKIYAIKQNPRKAAFDYLKLIRHLNPDKLPKNSYYYDKYSDAVVFFDKDEKLINKRFIKPQEGKSKALFEKGSTLKNVIYDKTFRPESDTVFIAEGVINALSLYQLGYSVLATFSTANLIDNKKLLERYLKHKNVVLAFDPDEAGTKTSLYYQNFISQNIEIDTLREFCGLPYKKDFNDYLQNKKADELLKLLNNPDNYNYIIYPTERIPLKCNVHNEREFEQINKFYFKDSRYFQIYRKYETETHLDVSDCVWSFLYRIIDGNGDATHLIKVQRIDNNGNLIIKLIEATTDEIQKDKFERKLNNIGFTFYGSAQIFNKIKLYNLHNETEVYKIEKYGYHPEYNLFFWSNVAVTPDGEVLHPNDLGIIQQTKAFYLETQSPANIKKRAFSELRKFEYKKGNLDTHTFLDLFYQAFGIRAFVGFAYLTASLFRDIIFAEIGRFPNLYLFGKAGTGKSAFSEILLALQGDYTGGYSLADTTQSAFSRVVDARINSLIYLKEYDDKLPAFVDEFLKTAYEGQGRTIGIKTTGNEVISYQSLTGILIDANFLPLNNEAVFTRMIIMDFQNTKFTNRQRTAFARISEEKKNGLSQIAVDLLAHRTEFAEFFPHSTKQHFNDLKHNFSYINDRLLIHSAMLLAVMEFLAVKYNLADYWKDYVYYVVELIKIQEQRLNSLQHSRLFWEAFAVGVKNHQIENYDNISIRTSNALFRIKEKDNIIALKSSDFKVFTQIYAKYCKDLNLIPLSPNMLKEELTNTEYFVKNTQKSRNTSITHTDYHLGSSLYFTYEKYNGQILYIDGVEIELSQ